MDDFGSGGVGSLTGRVIVPCTSLCYHLCISLDWTSDLFHDTLVVTLRVLRGSDQSPLKCYLDANLNMQQIKGKELWKYGYRHKGELLIMWSQKFTKCGLKVLNKKNIQAWGVGSWTSVWWITFCLLALQLF